MNFRRKLYSFFLFIALADGANIVVETSKGKVQGVLMTSKGNPNNQMLVFKGIPYAEPPVGDQRFRAPIPAQNWSDIRILTEIDKPFCPLTGFLYGFTGLMGYDENCLFVNVFSPSNVTSDSKLSVMVWIHGGGFMAGSGRYFLNGPDHLVDQNVIVVTLNYRIGALGFLSLGTDDAPGNAGLKDQALALKWVQEEIGKFGGDPNRVTIFGESAGSASVHFHVISEMSKGLFQQAIGESGVALSEWPFLSTGYIERAKQLADALGCLTTEKEVDVTCLQNANIEDIIDKQSISLSDEATIPGGVFPFVPVKEANTSETPFLSDIPENILKNPPSKIPMIMGVNQYEGVLFASSSPEFYAALPGKMQYMIPKSTRDRIDNDTLSNKIRDIEKFYFNDTIPTLQNLHGYVNLMTDKMFAVGTALTAKALAKYSDIYLYRFDFDGNFRVPYPPRKYLNLTGAAHADEVGYIFVLSQVNTEGFAEDSPENKMLRKMVKLWTNFAKFGTPTPGTSSDPDLEKTQWTPVSGNVTKYLDMNGNLTMSTDDFKAERVQFWENLISIPESENTTKPPHSQTTHGITTPHPNSKSNQLKLNMINFIFTIFIVLNIL